MAALKQMDLEAALKDYIHVCRVLGGVGKYLLPVTENVAFLALVGRLDDWYFMMLTE